MTTINDLVDDNIVEIYQHLTAVFGKENLTDYSWAAFKLANKRLFALCKAPYSLQKMVEFYRYNMHTYEIEEKLLALSMDEIDIVNYMYGGLLLHSSRKSSCILFAAIKHKKYEFIDSLTDEYGTKIACDVIDMKYLVDFFIDNDVRDLPANIMLIDDYIRDDKRYGRKYLDSSDIGEYRGFANNNILSRKFVDDFINKHKHPGITYRVALSPDNITCYVNVISHEEDITFNGIKLAAEQYLQRSLSRYRPKVNDKIYIYNTYVADIGVKAGDVVNFVLI
ncbi:methyltransferase [Faustovirus]|nr:methyltransferase [Faustovirus]